jgi:hypothetical protein
VDTTSLANTAQTPREHARSAAHGRSELTVHRATTARSGRSSSACERAPRRTSITAGGRQCCRCSRATSGCPPGGRRWRPSRGAPYGAGRGPHSTRSRTRAPADRRAHARIARGGRLRTCLRRSTGGRESAPLLPGGRASAGDASGDRVDRSPADHGLGHGRVAFVVAGQATVRGQPGEGALDRPPAGDHGEPTLAGRLAHDVQCGAQQGLCQWSSRPAKAPSAKTNRTRVRR